MKIEACNLSGKALDWAVGIAEGLDVDYTFCSSIVVGVDDWNGSLAYDYIFQPSEVGSQAIPLIEREKISVIYVNSETDPNPIEDGPWTAGCEGLEYGCTASTFIVAGLRCFVALKLGDEVEVPDELFE